MTFHQHFERVENVYNVGGDLVLTPNSSAAEFARMVEGLRADLARLEGLDEARRAQVDRELAGSATDARAPSPPKRRIAERLTAAAGTLRSLGEGTGAALNLAKIVADAASWAGEFL